MRTLASLVVIVIAACGPTGMSGPTMNHRVGGMGLASDTVVSTEILQREPRATSPRSPRDRARPAPRPRRP